MLHINCNRGSIRYACLCFCLLWALQAPLLVSSQSAKKPNIIMVLTDDQDYMLQSSSRQYMPNLHSLIGDQGLELQNFVVSMAWCCPSRASLLTGKLVHNTNITSSKMPRGGAQKFLGSNLASDYLPVWLQSLGYETYFTGKFLNLMPVADQSNCPKGWTLFEGMIDSYNNTYQNWYTRSYYSNNCSGIQTYEKYQTHIMRDKGLQYIDMAQASGKPFYIQLSPIAPHDQGLGKEAMPAPGDQDAYPGLKMPKSPNWGVKLPDLMYLSNGQTNWAWSNKKWQKRVRSLKAVDDMIGSLVSRLRALDILDDTYFIFTSDNGFHLGHHGIQYEKYMPYEEDVRVPLFIRGPKVPCGVKSDYQAAMVDVTATIVQLAGGDLLPQLDGVPFPFQGISQGLAGPIIQLHQPQPALPDGPPGVAAGGNPRFSLPPPGTGNKAQSVSRPPLDPVTYFPEISTEEAALTWSTSKSEMAADIPYTVRDSIMIEGWIDVMDPKLLRKDYRAVRVCSNWLLPSSNTSSQEFLGGGTCYKYIVWCIPSNPYTGRDTRYRELFDLGTDPHELNNLITPELETQVSRLVTRLNAILTVLAYCTGPTCRQPWLVLHAGGDVLSLAEAMDPGYDITYAMLTSFGYLRCTLHYSPANEIADPMVLTALQLAQQACGNSTIIAG